MCLFHNYLDSLGTMRVNLFAETIVICLGASSAWNSLCHFDWKRHINVDQLGLFVDGSVVIHVPTSVGTETE
jgi:hypothetical protein